MTEFAVHHINLYGENPEQASASLATELGIRQAMLGDAWKLHTVTEGGSCLSPATWILVWVLDSPELEVDMAYYDGSF